MRIGRENNTSSISDSKFSIFRIKRSDKKKLKRIDMDIVRRLLVFLYSDGKTKKTNIAMKCGMSYDKCVLYLDWMKTMSLIRNEMQDGFELISLNDRGMEFCKKNFEHS